MSKHRKQHFVPSCYLMAWCDPSAPKNHAPYVWVFSKDGTVAKNKAPDNIFHETDMYTITKADGKRNLVLENGLSQLESNFTKIRNRKLRFHKALSAIERAQICAFLAAMNGRTKVMRDHQGEQWGRLLERVETVKKWAETATQEELQRATANSGPESSSRDSLTYEQVRSIAAQPLQNMLPAIISVETPLLGKLDLAVFTAVDDIGFITSDNPCVWFDPKAYQRPPFYRAPALIYKSIEITLPISPEQCIYLNRQGINGYIPATQSVVDELNRRTRFCAGEYFVVRKKEKRSIWFDPGVEPEDSWEKERAKKAVRET